MAKLSDLKRHFADLIPQVLRSARRVLFRTGVGGVGFLSLGATGMAGLENQNLRQNTSLPALVGDRPKKASLTGKLILTLRTSAGHMLSFAHRSHSSHSSHSSHASHYSSRTGGTPAPVPPSPPAPSAPVQPWPPAPSAPVYPPPAAVQEIPLQSATIEITVIDRKARTVSGKTKKGELKAFYYAPETRLRRIVPREVTTTPFGNIIANESIPFPLSVDQEVLVQWRLDLRTSKITAVEFVIYE